MLETSPQTDKIYPALFKALKEMPNPTFNKNGQIQSRTYEYADLTAVNKVAKQHLFANGIMVIQPIIMAALETRLVHAASGQWISSMAGLPTSVPTMQNYGSNITYMRRYALNAILAIVGDGDDDGAAGWGGNIATPPPSQVGHLSAPEGNHNAATPAQETPPKSTFRDSMVKVTKELQAVLKDSGIRTYKKEAGDILAQVVAEAGGGTLDESMTASREIQKAIYLELTERIADIKATHESEMAAAADD